MNTLLGNNNAATRLKTINNEFLFMKLFDIFSPVTAPSQYCIHKFIRNLELCVIVDDAGHGFEERGKKDEEAVEEMEEEVVQQQEQLEAAPAVVVNEKNLFDKGEGEEVAQQQQRQQQQQHEEVEVVPAVVADNRVKEEVVYL